MTARIELIVKVVDRAIAIKERLCWDSISSRADCLWEDQAPTLPSSLLVLQGKFQHLPLHMSGLVLLRNWGLCKKRLKKK